MNKLKWIVSASGVACALVLAGCDDSSDKACSDYTTEDDCTGKTDKDGKTCTWNGTACVAETTGSSNPQNPSTTSPQTSSNAAELQQQVTALTKERDQLKMDLANNVTDPVSVKCADITDKTLCVGACKYTTKCEDDTTTQTSDCKGNTYANCLKAKSTKRCEWSTGGCWQPVQQKYCINKVNLDWSALKIAPSTSLAPTDQMTCDEIKFGPDQVQPYEWFAGGTCALHKNICFLGATRATNGNDNYADWTTFFTRVRNAGTANFRIRNAAGAPADVQNPCNANGTFLAALANNDPCSPHKKYTDCINQAVVAKFAGAGALLRSGDNDITLTEQCRFQGKDEGCYLKDVIPEFNCAKASLTDCAGKYKDVCMLLDTATATPSK
ncbi:MAG: hypothetical protein AAF320_03255 [Myxococcota bacterium]